MIKFYGANEKLTNTILPLKNMYPDDVEILETKCKHKDITIFDGIPVILKYYNLDNKFRLEIGSYLSDIINSIDYVYVEIV